MMTARFTSCLSPAAVMLLLAAAAPLHAQGAGLRLTPRIGVYSPAGALTEHTEIENALVAGIAAELLLPDIFFDLRLTFDHVTRTDLLVRGTPPESRLGRIALTAITAGVVLRPFPAALLLEPHFVAGLGVKRYDLDIEPVPAPPPAGGEFGNSLDSSRRFTLHAAIGFGIPAGPVRVQVEFSDYISTFVDGFGESRLQNDLVATLGIGVRLF